MGSPKGKDQVQLELTARVESIARPAEPQVFKVSQIVRLAAKQLERRFYDVWVEGEVSNLRRPASGHAYFTLKDTDAQLASVVFRSTLLRLGLEPRDGQLLRCRGQLSIYERQGRFQLTVEHAQLAGRGALQAAFERLKRKLASEGLFDAARKRPLPPFPRRIAVVTSRSGAALRDIMRVLEQRLPVRITVCPATVQGPEAPAEICAALRQADDCGAQLIIVGRGGGSLEDLWAFNDEGVARTIIGLRTPVISAVGHEIDYVISDFVADARAPTPSAAAELAVPVFEEVCQRLRLLTDRLGRGMRQQVRHNTLDLTRLQARLGTPRRLVDRNRMRIDDLRAQLELQINRALRARQQRLSGLRLRLSGNQPNKRLAHQRSKLERLSARQRAAVGAQLDRRRAALAQAVATLQALSPLAVLGRGYGLAIAEDGNVVRDAGAMQVGDRLKLRLHRGQLLCTVEEVQANGSNRTDGDEQA